MPCYDNAAPDGLTFRPNIITNCTSARVDVKWRHLTAQKISSDHVLSCDATHANWLFPRAFFFASKRHSSNFRNRHAYNGQWQATTRSTKLTRHFAAKRTCFRTYKSSYLVRFFCIVPNSQIARLFTRWCSSILFFANPNPLSAMAYRTLELTLISAKDLKDVNLISKMAVYAVVSLSGDPRTKQRTPPDREGGRNPSWNSTFRISVPADADVARNQFLHILLRAERSLGDRDVGVVRVPLTDLLSGAGDGPRPVQYVSYQVRKTTSGKPEGVLNFSYKLGERIGAAAAGPAPPAGYPAKVTAYPPPAAPPAGYPPQVTAYPPPAAAPYPPPPASKADEPVLAYPAGTSYGVAPTYPPPAGYHQPPVYQPPSAYQQAPPYPPPYGYGYGAPPPQVVQPPRKNNIGMGLGAGLLGGALGGLLIGDMLSDDTGYDDAGGFDF